MKVNAYTTGDHQLDHKSVDGSVRPVRCWLGCCGKLEGIDWLSKVLLEALRNAKVVESVMGSWEECKSCGKLGGMQGLLKAGRIQGLWKAGRNARVVKSWEELMQGLRKVLWVTGRNVRV
ncbi:hypothetical protein Pmani_001418 [Petrolisthes manimaculis]|uniref:Uncharacterized protein n=1 Tax=Petrolisthes manimaculis TaxID=1843537 RepID=A0AAE1QM78_9EUCA|nr:hypothetical protein Pmani_001418 [Petrolisthes manimaculis]